MNEGQIKLRILLIRSVDILFLLAVFFFGGYSVLYSENHFIMGAITLVGLFLVNKLGNFSTTRIVGLRHELKKLQREEQSRR